MTTESTSDAVAPSAPPAVASVPAAAEPARQEPTAPSAPVGELLVSTESSVAAPPSAPAPGAEEAPPAVAPEGVPQEVLELVAVAPAAPVARALEPPAPEVPPPVASAAPADTLDFSALVTRLRKTRAIGLAKKVAVKNESDELLEQFRAYHGREGIATLADLRRSYDLLFHKLHSLLKDTDPPLARDIARSRTAIWELLADPRKFSASELMAGA